MSKVHKEVIREQYPVLYNETPSLTDSVYRDENDPFRDLNPQAPAQTTQVVTRGTAARAHAAQLQPLPSASEIIQKYSDSISEHMSRRVNSLFLQLVCCYKTQLHFEIGDTLAQGASVAKLELSGLDDKGNVANLVIQRNAAHSSTLPCLVVSDGRLKKFFLLGTDAFRIWNATINMPAWINKVDIKIDGDSSSNKLRSKTLYLINRVAREDLDPVQGLVEFIRSAIAEVEHANKEETNPVYREILTLYQRELKSILEEDCDMSARIESLLGTTVFDPALRQVTYEIRYDAIRSAQFYQEELIQKVHSVKGIILTDILKTVKRKPDHFEAAFRTLLIEEVPKDDHFEKNRGRIEKLYNFSPFDFESRLRSGTLTKYKNTKKMLSEKYKKDIQTLSKELCDTMKKFRKEQREKIGKTVKLLRKTKHWRKEELAKQIPMERKKLSRIESGKEPVPSEMIEKFSRTLEVSSNLFVPEFFYS